MLVKYPYNASEPVEPVVLVYLVTTKTPVYFTLKQRGEHLESSSSAHMATLMVRAGTGTSQVQTPLPPLILTPHSCSNPDADGPAALPLFPCNQSPGPTLK